MREWVENQDRDLRERERVGGYEFGMSVGVSPRPSSLSVSTDPQHP